jgi:hypothetical protein
MIIPIVEAREQTEPSGATLTRLALLAALSRERR